MQKQGLLAVLLVGVLGLGTVTACDSGGSGGTGGTGGGGSGGTGGGGSGGGGSGGATGGGGNGGTGGMVAMPTCADYCTAIQANCPMGVNQQYSSEAICLATCAAFTAGNASDMAGNTLGCRIYHAGAAASAPATHCAHAGPGGAGVCGNNCDGFCAVVQHACTAGNQQYADVAACLSECSGFPGAADNMPPYSANVASGDSFACRMYHATVASTDAATHCEHVDEGMPNDMNPCTM